MIVGRCATAVTAAIYGVEPNAGIAIDVAAQVVAVSAAEAESPSFQAAIEPAGHTAGPGPDEANAPGGRYNPPPPTPNLLEIDL